MRTSKKLRRTFKISMTVSYLKWPLHWCPSIEWKPCVRGCWRWPRKPILTSDCMCRPRICIVCKKHSNSSH